MLTLYILRHGETDFNLQGIVQGGGVDSDLNATGLAQGKAFFEAYKHIPFEKVYASNLKRTYQTLHYFEALGHTIIRDADINELGWGDLEGQSASENTKMWFTKITDAWMSGDLEAKMPNGESPIEVWDRCKRFFDALFESHPTGNVLICTHGRTLRLVLSQLIGNGMNEMHHFHHDNTGLNILQVHTDGAIKSLVLNDTSHLEAHGLIATRVDYRK